MAGLRGYLHHQLFDGVEPDGRLTWMNRVLVVVIIAAVTAAVLATEPSIAGPWHSVLIAAEVAFGAVFLLEYLARIHAAAEQPGPKSAFAKRMRFILSPLGLIDLLVVATSLFPLFVANAAVLRIVRLLRVLATIKFGRFSKALREVFTAIRDRAEELLVTGALSLVAFLLGATALYFAEHEAQPEAFGSILRALYWSVITLTQVGYGDVVPVTALGKFFASVIAIAGIALVAMPIGIFAAAFSEAMQHHRDLRIEELRRQLEQLDTEDQRIAAKLAALERLSKRD
ncbi:ion transporter [Altererythrobacter salegens]|uniref:Ion transporter n=1 Tax=Croceibacterium salegens TaxID=1737568 RepID=A0A6I4ST50_9SPHN|nr:ion transporter [Croceibacterium salegens]MXO59083.1 ion transporter [Croceibacterium salegens]